LPKIRRRRVRVKKISKKRKSSRKEENVEVEKPKKEFKIEVVKVGKLDEKTGGRCPNCYECFAPPC
jgi:hypothetical protein